MTTVSAGELEKLVLAIFAAAGFGTEDAAEIARALVDADLRGLPSHGVMLVPMYLARLRAGTVRRGGGAAEIVSDAGGLVVLDAGNALGQLTSARAVDLAVGRARRFGIGAVAVRNAMHFGAAGYWAARAVAGGCVGVAMSNTRPMMPAPGGATPVVGNNPVAVAVPVDDGLPLEFDMATSEAALGKIRLAHAENRPIPDGWATDAAGSPTTDAGEAIGGMLLPAGGPKGFGLALMIDLLTGVLGGGGFGASVRPLYAELDRPNNCAHLFVAIDPRAAVPGFPERAGELARFVRSSPTAPGAAPVRTPGMAKQHTLVRRHATGIPVPASTLDALRAEAAGLGLAWELTLDSEGSP
ncbi:Ldh family oxidoreductase [Pseudonocardia acaciae]|uniref:Ldh family oxidoreductase n=1 Tax=Pseudonocardia acaciae TaxID=551276 RepID=UPI0005647162|nr:Ldh family oxidoreductase [Pseudonocardia acaciae]